MREGTRGKENLCADGRVGGSLRMKRRLPGSPLLLFFLFCLPLLSSHVSFATDGAGPIALPAGVREEREDRGYLIITSTSKTP